MFFSQSEAILGRIHDHLAAWRASGPDAELLGLLRGEFSTLKSGADDAGFDDVSRLSHSVENLLAQSGDVAGPDDVGLLNLLEETHDGLVADLGFVPLASRDQVQSLNSLVASLLGDGPQTEGTSLHPAGVAVGAFDECLPQLRRVAEAEAEASGKQVELSLTGGGVEAERRVLERITAAFAHLIRCSVAHGIESAEQRAASGKDAAGRIGIAVVRRGGELLIEYWDDGRGLDAEKLAADAVAAGMVQRADEIGEEHLLQILARPGGGLEAVCRAVRELGGLMAVKSEIGTGVRVQFLLPAILGAQRALLVTAGKYRFAIPAHTIERVMRVPADEVPARDGQTYLAVGERRIPVVNLAARVGADDAQRTQPAAFTLLVLIRLADRVSAFAVDEFHDIHAINDPAPKNPGAQLASIRGLAGVAVLADSGRAVILDPGAFIHRELPERHGLTRFPLGDCDLFPASADSAKAPEQSAAPEKTMRVVVLETPPGPLVIPASLVAEVVGGVEPQPSGREHEWICGDFLWRGFAVPVINNTTAFAADEDADAEESEPCEHAVILWPMKDTRPDEFFALTGSAPPRVVEIAPQPAPTPPAAAATATATANGQPPNLLGYVQIDRRTGLIPDLKSLAHGIFHDR